MKTSESASHASRGRTALLGLAALLAAAAGLFALSRRDASRPSGTKPPARIAEVRLANRTVRPSGFPTTFCDHQKASARGTAPYVVVVSDPKGKLEAIKAVRACGARVIGPLPPDALLVETSIFALGKMSVDPRFAAAAEWLPEDKVDPRFAKILAANPDKIDATVVTLAADDVDRVAGRIAAAGGERLAGCLNGKSSVTLRLPRTALADLVKDGDVRWIEPFSRPELLNDVAVGPTAMNVRTVWNAHGLTGTNQVITTSDSGIDTGDLSTMHRDLRSRLAGISVVENGFKYDKIGHGTHTAGSIVGDGTMSDGEIRGVAYGAKLWAWFCYGTYTDAFGVECEGVLIPDDVGSLFRPDGATNACIHSASWGDDDEGCYGDQSRTMDEYVWEHPEFLPVIANGNSGYDSKSQSAVYGTVGSPATAKNVLAVGATQNARTGGASGWGNGDPSKTARYSSRGPCQDGRIKPDVAAPGSGVLSTRAYACSYDYGVGANTNYAYDSGTSMATPLTAGAAALVRQWLVEKRAFTNGAPSSALVKAVLTGGATRTLEPDDDQGWGRVDLEESLFPSNRAVQLVDRIPFSQGSEYACRVTLTNSSPFDVQLVWTDYPGTAGYSRTLVNDLDLVVSNCTSGAVFFGNGVTGGDRTNTLETLRLSMPDPGEYAVIVRGYDISYASDEGGAAALYLRGAFEPKDAPVVPTSFEIVDASPAESSGKLQVGETCDFSVTVSVDTGAQYLSYVWTVDGAEVAGATSNAFPYAATWSDRGDHEIAVVASIAGMYRSRVWHVGVWGDVSVEATGDDETATGEASKPFRTISAALATAQTNEVVRVGPGTFAGGVVAPFATARVESRQGPASTFIDGGGTDRCFDGSANTNAVLSGFTLTNGVAETGAGACGGVLTNCVIAGCAATAYGGGAYAATLIDCRVENCSAAEAGGGIYGCTATRCLIAGNAASTGGGASGSTLTHCTVRANEATSAGGGVDAVCVCTDSIVWDNALASGEEGNWELRSLEYHDESTSFDHCCTTPAGFTDRGGNVTDAPLWLDAPAGDLRLLQRSPCLHAASDYGNMGVWQGEGVPGCLITAVASGSGEISPATAYVPTGGTATFTATVHHPFLGWTTNGVAVAATTNVFVWSGIREDGTIGASFLSTNFYVDASAGDDASNGWTWASAKRTLQAAAAVVRDGETVTVNPGVYAGPVVLTSSSVVFVSTGGSDVTTIDGGGTNRCVDASAGTSSTVSGFTLANGATAGFGGGAYGGTYLGCVIRDCSAASGGGGAYAAMLYDCTVAGCSTEQQGGGAGNCYLENCTLRGNGARTRRSNDSTSAGGGVDYQCNCLNTLIQQNTGPDSRAGAPYDYDDWEECIVRDYPQQTPTYSYPVLSYCCYSRTHQTSYVADCLETNAEYVGFVSTTDADARLFDTSPCLGTGQNGANIGAYLGSGVEHLLPPLTPTLDIRNAVASMGYADSTVVDRITNATQYAAFAVWTTNSPPITSRAVYLSTRSFESFVVRDIVASPRLLAEGCTSAIRLTALKPSSDGTTASTTVSLFDGGELVPLRAVSDVYAAKSRLGSAVTQLFAADAGDMTATQAVDNASVTLTVALPDAVTQYYLRFALW